MRSTARAFANAIPMAPMSNSMMLQRSEILTKAGFTHAFSTRQGGVSVAPFHSADFALLRDAVALRENQRRLALALGFDPSRLFQAEQVHGAAVFVPGQSAEDLNLGKLPDVEVARYAKADALVAREPGDTVGVRVADCVPILVADQGNGRVAAIHAGWKGVVADVIGHALAALEPGAPSELVAAIGPCIGACCFEVSHDVAEKIAAASTPACIVSRHAPLKAMVDLRLAAAAQLARLGMDGARVEQVGGCTRCDAAMYYSFRRDGDDAGRLLAVITARTAG